MSGNEVNDSSIKPTCVNKNIVKTTLNRVYLKNTEHLEVLRTVLRITKGPFFVKVAETLTEYLMKGNPVTMCAIY